MGNRILAVLGVLCVAAVLADLGYHKHGHYPFEEWIGFHAAFGFATCLALGLVAGLLRRLIARDEDYYG